MNSKEIECVFILTQHNSHSKLVTEALNRGKNVFVEKPLVLTIDVLDEIDDSKKDDNIAKAEVVEEKEESEI